MAAPELFLLTPLREGRRPWGRRGSTQNGFLLTPLREGRQSPGASLSTIILFLLTPLREGRPAHCRAETEAWLFLLTPLREGRRIVFDLEFAQNKISTHAPAGGATISAVELVPSIRFLLTPLREGRQKRNRAGRNVHDFYSRPCGRGDCVRAFSFCGNRIISTHAPAGGATFAAFVFNSVVTFLLTPLREGRPGWMRGTTESTYFYSRPCGRGDTERKLRLRDLCDFYSRPCGRGDENAPAAKIKEQISTHAPAGGATRFGVHAQNAGDDFYSRPCGRGDASRCIVIESIDKISTHAPAGGATRHEHKKRINIADFYSRPCGRGDVFLPVAGSL